MYDFKIFTCCCRLPVTAEFEPRHLASSLKWCWGLLPSGFGLHHRSLTNGLPAERVHTVIITLLPRLQEAGQLWEGTVESLTAGGREQCTKGSSKSTNRGPPPGLITERAWLSMKLHPGRAVMSEMRRPHQPWSHCGVYNCNYGSPLTIDLPQCLLLRNQIRNMMHRRFHGCMIMWPMEHV